MSREVKRNIAHSVNARLKNLAIQKGIDVEYMYLKYAFERFLYRLSVSEHCRRFILKGAAVFSVWIGPMFRVTRDIDFECRGLCDAETIKGYFKDVCLVDVRNDGVRFDSDSISINDIKKDDKYKGFRVVLISYIDQARVKLQFDIGFGDSVFPDPEVLQYPVLLAESEVPSLQIYPQYTVVAEKFEAMVALGMLNSRIKDYYDIWLLTEKFDFDFDLLATAVKRTFLRHEICMPSELPIGLTKEFAEDAIKKSQWKSFINKVSPIEYPKSLGEAITRIGELISPIVFMQGTTPLTWIKAKGWIV